MNDDVKALIERVRGGVETSGWACDALDPRHVLDLLAHIDDEPARLAAAVESFALEVDHERDERLARAEKAEAERDALKDAAEANLAVAEKCSEAIDVVCAERDALRAQVEAARAEAAKWPGQCGKFVLRAMDEAKP